MERKRPTSIWGGNRELRFSERRSTSRSWALVPTRGSRTCAQPQRSPKDEKLSREFARLVVPGSAEVKKLAEQEGLHEIFEAAGFRVARSGLFDVSRDES